MAEGKCRNKRWRVTSAETSFLEAVFLRTRKPSRATIEHLATSLAVRPRQVQVWFQNRRQRWRKEFSSEAAFSPTDADGMQDGDTVHPASLDAIMRQFLGPRPRGGGGGGGEGVGGGSHGGSERREGDDEMDDFELELDGDDTAAGSHGGSRDGGGACGGNGGARSDGEMEQPWTSLSRAFRPAPRRVAAHATLSSDGAVDEDEAAYLHDLASVLDIRPERDGARGAHGDGDPDADGDGSLHRFGADGEARSGRDDGCADDDAESEVQQHEWSRIIRMDWLDDDAATADGADAGSANGCAGGDADAPAGAGGAAPLGAHAAPPLPPLSMPTHVPTSFSAASDTALAAHGAPKAGGLAHKGWAEGEGFLTPTLRLGAPPPPQQQPAAAAATGADSAGSAGALLLKTFEALARADGGGGGAGSDGAGAGVGGAEQHCAAKAMAIASYLESVCDVLAI
ncbi:hypothetical protein KFE25_004677 [Diacronema lutheri]|uniref:Homeobox domain-containing protein n=1 Tax=Diacronema lutheri TaxID=2081491 RepID=A0A8J5X7A1_DIALT|nr:hypothetical protein KFE25_004677 [Diacronema lutheri]